MDAHANFPLSTVATAPSPATSGTSLVVGSGHGTRFPAVPFNATIKPAGIDPDPSNAEIVRVTAITTDTFTITRAQESSSARTVIVGDQIYAGITKKTLTDIETTVVTSLPGSPLNGDSVILTDSVTAPTYNWHLRYDSSITSNSGLYKWRYLGGAAIEADGGVGSITGGSVTYALFSTGGGTGSVSVVLPTAGIFDIFFGGAVFDSVGASQPLTVTVKLGTSAAADAESTRTWIAATANNVYNISRKMRRTLASAMTLQLYGKSGAASGDYTIENAFLYVTPVLLG